MTVNSVCMPHDILFNEWRKINNATLLQNDQIHFLKIEK